MLALDMGNFVHYWWDRKLIQALWNSMEDPQKIIIELPYDPAISQLEIYPKETKALTQKDIWRSFKMSEE